MFSARSAVMDAEFPRPGPAAGKNVETKTFIHYAAFKAHVTCAAFPATGG
jgi:hypothetical protein